LRGKEFHLRKWVEQNNTKKNIKINMCWVKVRGQLIHFIIKMIIMIRQLLSVSDLFCWTRSFTGIFFTFFLSSIFVFQSELLTTNCKIPHSFSPKSWDDDSPKWTEETCEWISSAFEVSCKAKLKHWTS
jgi:hypothetical protein